MPGSFDDLREKRAVLYTSILAQAQHLSRLMEESENDELKERLERLLRRMEKLYERFLEEGGSGKMNFFA